MADVRNIARSRLPNAGARMSKFLRKPEASLWVLSISQAAAMLALQRRAARGRLVKHLPLFFDLAGRKVVVIGRGADGGPPR